MLSHLSFARLLTYPSTSKGCLSAFISLEETCIPMLGYMNTYKEEARAFYLNWFYLLSIILISAEGGYICFDEKYTKVFFQEKEIMVFA